MTTVERVVKGHKTLKHVLREELRLDTAIVQEMRPCFRCRGRGAHLNAFGYAWLPCADCDGTGLVWDGPLPSYVDLYATL